MSDKVNINGAFGQFQENWRPKVVAHLNGQEVKVVKIQGEFPWHFHEDADEFFLCWSGLLRVEFRDKVVELNPGECIVIPRGIEGEEREAGLTFLRWMMQPAQANEWATKTGYMPVSRPGYEALAAEGYYQTHPNDRVTLDQLAVAQPWPWSTNLFRVQREAVQPRLEAAVRPDADPAALLAEARKAVPG